MTLKLCSMAAAAKAEIRKQYAQRTDERPARAATGATTQRSPERTTK